MFLKSLTVRSHGQLVREIRFRRGVNLILDSTSGVPTDSGNSVGKTTVLRAVDYCLGGDGARIYRDPEFKDKRNETVYEFLTTQSVEFELVIEHQGESDVVVTREFGGRALINGREYGNDDFKGQLGHLLFGLVGTKPSFRQLIGKFIRIEAYQLSNTVRYLHPTAPANDYDSVFLYLFGFRDQGLLVRRRETLDELKKLKKRSAALRGVSKASLGETIAVIERDIEMARQRAETMDVSNILSSDLVELERARRAVAALSLEVANVNMRLRLNQDAVGKLERATSDIDISVLEELYRQASSELPSLTRKFAEVVEFHNKMIAAKVRFISQSTRRLQGISTEKSDELQRFSAQETELLRKVGQTGALSDFRKLYSEIETLVAEKARREAILFELEAASSHVANAQSRLDDINEDIKLYQRDLFRHVRDFNVKFSEYAQRLYGEKFVLSIDLVDGDGSRLLDIQIGNVSANEGSGKKRVQVTAFDLAFLALMERYGAGTVRFTLHDKIEDVSVNQLRTLFEIADSIDGQYVVAMLSDKLEAFEPAWIESHTVVTLSQGDKFFRLQ